MKRLLIAIAASWVSVAGAAYKCVDAGGITHIGDTPPAGCAAVMMYEITKTGKVVRSIEPTLTPEQAKARQQEIERKKAADKVAGEQKRKDAALLHTYGSEKEFDVARDRNIEPIKTRISTAADRIKAVEKRQQVIEEEMEFYKSGKKSGKSREAPANLTSELQRVRAEKAALLSTIIGYEKEIEQVKLKYDTDKKRWADLKNAPSKAADPAPRAEAPTVKKN